MRNILVLLIALAFAVGFAASLWLVPEDSHLRGGARATPPPVRAATAPARTAEAVVAQGDLAPGARDLGPAAASRPRVAGATGDVIDAGTASTDEPAKAEGWDGYEDAAQERPTDPANAAFWYYSLGEVIDDVPLEMRAAIELGATGDLADLELEYEDEWEDIIDVTQQALECEECRWPGFENGGNYLIQLPYLPWLEWAGLALRADAWRLHRQGRSVEAISRYDYIFELAVDLESTGIMISTLFAGRIRRTAMESMQQLLGAADDAALYARAIDTLARQEVNRSPLSSSLAQEMALARNTLEGFVHGDAETQQLLADVGVEVPEDAESLEHLLPQLDRLEAHLAEVETQMRLPLRQALPIIELLERRIHESAQNAPLIQALVPSLLPLVLAEADALGRLRGLRVWSGVHLHRLLTGELPEDLGPVAALLSGLPTDPLTDAPPHYRRWNERDAFSLWMVGRNLTNDEGSAELDLVIHADR